MYSSFSGVLSLQFDQRTDFRDSRVFYNLTDNCFCEVKFNSRVLYSFTHSVNWLFRRQTSFHWDLTFAKSLQVNTGYLKGSKFSENKFLQNLLLRMRCPNNISGLFIANKGLLWILRYTEFFEYWVVFDWVLELLQSYRNHFCLKFRIPCKSIYSVYLNIENCFNFREILRNSFLWVVILQYFAKFIFANYHKQLKFAEPFYKFRANS